MKAAVAKQKGAPLVLEERPLPEPGEGAVRIRVHACGICHSDQFVVEGIWPSLKLPRVPGHEVAGVVDAVGPGVRHVQPGARVGVGWYGGHCGVCRACREGDFVLCENGPVTGISFDGGYEEYMLASVSALAMIPEDLDFAEAAPLLCAGVTTFNSLRNSGARAGDVVAVHGLGGLGHLGVQFARAMGFYVVAIARGAEKADLAKKLGAHEYLDATQGDMIQGLQKLGGASVILSTAVSGQAASELVNGLGRNGCLVVLGASPDPITIRSGSLIGGRRRIQGWPSGQASDSEDTLRFAQLHGIRPRIETFPLAEAQAAYQHMMQGKARFRAVLKAI
jgi:D-arabinose 1-dehydrogenase-like Zn-dependent alcohol dehydrogenase